MGAGFGGKGHEKMNDAGLFLCAVNGVAAVLEKIINCLACVLLAVVALAVIIQVCGRWGNIPVVWLGELSTFAVIWSVFLGLAIGYRHGLFAQVDIICHLLPTAWRKYLVLVWDMIAIVIITWILWSARDYIAYAARRKMLSPELRWPLYAVYMGPVLGYLFILYFTFANVVNNVAALFQRAAMDGAADADGPEGRV